MGQKHAHVLHNLVNPKNPRRLHAKQKPKIFPKQCSVFVCDVCFDGNVYIFGVTFLFCCECGLKKRKKCFVLSFKVCRDFLDDLSDFMVQYGFENRSKLLRKAVREFMERRRDEVDG